MCARARAAGCVNAVNASCVNVNTGKMTPGGVGTRTGHTDRQTSHNRCYGTVTCGGDSRSFHNQRFVIELCGQTPRHRTGVYTEFVAEFVPLPSCIGLLPGGRPSILSHKALSSTTHRHSLALERGLPQAVRSLLGSVRLGPPRVSKGRRSARARQLEKGAQLLVAARELGVPLQP